MASRKNVAWVVAKAERRSCVGRTSKALSEKIYLIRGGKENYRRTTQIYLIRSGKENYRRTTQIYLIRSEKKNWSTAGPNSRRPVRDADGSPLHYRGAGSAQRSVEKYLYIVPLDHPPRFRRFLPHPRPPVKKFGRNLRLCGPRRVQSTRDTHTGVTESQVRASSAPVDRVTHV